MSFQTSNNSHKATYSAPYASENVYFPLPDSDFPHKGDTFIAHALGKLANYGND